MASNLCDLYRLFGIENSFKLCNNPNKIADGHVHASLNKKTRNPIITVSTRNNRHGLSSARNNNIDDDKATNLHRHHHRGKHHQPTMQTLQTSSSSSMRRQTKDSNPLRRSRNASNHTSKPTPCLLLDDKPHTKSPFDATLDSSLLRRYSFCNNHIDDAEEPLKSNEHELLDAFVEGANYHDDNDIDDGENLQYYIRLASRCYRDGFQWYADYLRGKGTSHQLDTTNTQLTRRPLQLIIERHLEQRNNKESEQCRPGRQWWTPQVASDDNCSQRPLQSTTTATTTTTTSENKREFEIRIEISHPTDKYRLTQQVHARKHSSTNIVSFHGQTTTRSPSSSSENHKPHQLDIVKNDHSSLPTPSATESHQLINDFSKKLNISPICSRDVPHQKLPQIVLNDCCENNYVCDDDSDACSISSP